MWTQFVADPTNVAATAPACSATTSGPAKPPTLPQGVTVTFPAGTYTVSGTSRLSIVGASNVIIDGTGATLQQTAQPCGSSPMFFITSSDHIAIQHTNIIGANPGAPNNYNANKSSSCGEGHGIQIYGTQAAPDGTYRPNSDISVVDCNISQTWGDGIYVNTSQRVLITGTTIRNSGREGIGVMGFSQDVNIAANTIANAGIQIGIDAEPNNSSANAAWGPAGITRMAVTGNNITGTPTAQVDISAHQLDNTTGKPPITITDVNIANNTSSDPLIIIVQGKPWFAPVGQSPAPSLVTSRLNSGQVRRVNIDANTSTGSAVGSTIVISGAVYASATNNSAPSGALMFDFWDPHYTSCFAAADYNNVGFTRQARDATPHQQLPGQQQSVDQFINRASVFATGERVPAATVTQYEWQMCTGTTPSTPVAALDTLIDTPDSAGHSGTTLGKRVEMVTDMWVAATGSVPSASVIRSEANLDPGSATLAGSPGAQAVASAILAAHPDLVTEPATTLINSLFLNAFGHPPSTYELTIWTSILNALSPDATTARTILLAAMPSASSAGVTIQAYLTPWYVATVSDLVTLNTAPTTADVVSVRSNNLSRDALLTLLLAGNSYATLAPVAPTAGL